jgi:hypothetical protein
MKERKKYSGRCKTCEKIVRIYPAVPGDWLSCLYPMQHKDKSGNDCDGRYVEVDEIFEPTSNL